MKILIVCDEGLNRSATIRGQIQYWGHDCLTIGLNRNSMETLDSLTCYWAELIIFTEKSQVDILGQQLGLDIDKRYLVADDLIIPYQVWDIGPDNYPRPYNTELLTIIKGFVKEHEQELKPTST